MKLHFDGDQAYQWAAIQAVTDIFKGQLLSDSGFEFTQSFGAIQYNENSFGNQLLLTDDQVLENVRIVQRTNQIITEKEGLQGMNFSVEMETGTGKTYVYIKTIYELNKLYGFKKYVIVVPSIAIREGVLKNLQITHTHFQSLYNRTPISFTVYDSKNIPQLRNFASANTIQILVINIDSFTKDDNIINKPNDRTSGKKPIEFIQGCSPVVIVDEPQKMETAIRKKGIDNLNPMCTLRYSATHTNLYNLLYSLNPVKAYDLGLVKQIEVDSIVSENAMNDAFMQLEKIIATKTKITAQLKIDCNTANGPVKKTIAARNGDDLYKLSHDREVYKNGFIITEIDAGNGLISFSNGLQIAEGEIRGGMNEQVIRYMIQKTIEEHLKKELKLRAHGIKVLSLFFIDKVKNYREYDDQGNELKGKYALWFEEIFSTEIKKNAFKDLYTHLKSSSLLEAIVHDGYFSSDNKGRIKDTNGDTQSDDDMYKLIMQDKERLLDLNTPLRFIFSHSALTEGWDNPNVFQICTLNETKSEIKKRQEIGRGLRLPVNQEGQRISDPAINRLTVIANESYDDFAKALQQEIEHDCGVSFTGRIKDKRKKEQVNLRTGFKMDDRFLAIWNRIKFQTRYSISFDSISLINNAAANVAAMVPIKRPSVQSSKKKLLFTDAGIQGQQLSNSVAYSNIPPFDIPDVLSYIQSKTELTRKTIFLILQKSGRLNDLFTNPQLFMDSVVAIIKSIVKYLMVDGIKYEKIDDQTYEISIFDDEAMEIYPNSFTFNVSNPDKTIYENCIALDSNVENIFVKDCESSEDIEFYFKLPPWFKITTPIGSYNPDWAIVYKGEQKIYFVAETKGAGQELRESEKMKIRCGKAHFSSFEEVQYEQISTVAELSKL